MHKNAVWDFFSKKNSLFCSKQDERTSNGQNIKTFKIIMLKLYAKV